MLDKLGAEFQFNEKALSLRAQRQGILVSNIANADTPRYQARDINFATELKYALDKGHVQSTGLSLTSTRHIPFTQTPTSDIDLMYRVPDQPALDGNTVDMDRERVEFLENSLKYQSILTDITSQIQNMKHVLEGK